MAEPPVPGARLLVPAARVARAWTRLAAGLQPLVDATGCVFIGVMVGGMVPLVEIARQHGARVIDARKDFAAVYRAPHEVDAHAATGEIFPVGGQRYKYDRG